MTVTKTEVLASLERVASPEGVALPKTGALSEIVVSDGQVFFSITVDAAVVNAWEPVRKRAEAAVRALPGIASVMVALTAERTARAASAPAPRGRSLVRHPRPLPRPRNAPTAPPQFPASAPSSRSLPARAGSANPRRRSILRWACAISGSKWGFSMPTFTALRSQNCSLSKASLAPPGAPGSFRWTVMG